MKKTDPYDFSEDPDPKPHHGYTLLAGICIVLGLLFSVLLFINRPIEADSIKDYFTINGTIGDFISGTAGTLFSLAGFFLIYLTFKSQNDNFEVERIENRFFELIRWHRENVNEMAYDDATDDRKKYKGQRVFKFITDQIEECYNEIAPFFNQDENAVFHKEFLDKIRPICLVRKEIDLISIAKCEIAYAVVFFGLSDADLNTVSKHLSKSYKDNFYLPILRYLHLKPTKKSVRYKNWKAINEVNLTKLMYEFNEITKNKDFVLNLPDNDNHVGDLKLLITKKYFRYYGGHQFKLGHYFRHIYQTVKYIDGQSLNYDEKYNYIKILRGQFSTYEQVIFFFNSLTFMGRIWELDFVADSQVNNQLITKYNLIKNLSELHIFKEIQVKHYYPNVAFEFEKEPNGRTVLITQYS